MEYAQYLLDWNKNFFFTRGLPMTWEEWVRDQLRADMEANPARTQAKV